MDDEFVDHCKHFKTMDWLNKGAKVGHMSSGNVWLIESLMIWTPTFGNLHGADSQLQRAL
jgi:hypothetical protein